MQQKKFFYFNDLSKLAMPLMMGNLVFMLIGVGDVLVAGRYSTDTLASISIANAIINCIFIFGIGILASISPILSNYRGEGKDITRMFSTTIRFAMVLSAIISVVILCIVPFIGKIGLEENLVPDIKNYLLITAFSTFGGYLHFSVKEYLQAFQIVIFPNILTGISIFLNLGLNIILVFGHWGLPELGATGLAIASLIVRYFMGFVLLIYCLYRIKVKKHRNFKFCIELLRVGFPSSVAILIEFVGFNIITLLMGKISGIYSAAHNILTTIANLTFTLPLAVSNATAIKTGYTNGAKYFKSLKKFAGTGILFSVSFMACMGIILALIPKSIIGLFTNDDILIKTCVPIVYVLACFQIFDGMQITLAGIFRGLKKTNTVMISNLISYWFIAFPIGYILAFKFNLNLLGFWIGILFSSVVLCTIMLVFLQNKLKVLK